MSTWEQTPAGVLRSRAGARLPGPDFAAQVAREASDESRQEARQHYRRVWSDSAHRFTDSEGVERTIDNSAVRAKQLELAHQLAAEGLPIAWISAPDSGWPDPLTAPLRAAAAAAAARMGIATQAAGPDETWSALVSEAARVRGSAG